MFKITRQNFFILIGFTYLIIAILIIIPTINGYFEDMTPQSFLILHSYFAPQYAILLTKLADIDKGKVIKNKVVFWTLFWLVIYFLIPALMIFYQDIIYQITGLKFIQLLISIPVQVSILIVEIVFGIIFYHVLANQ